MSAAALEIQSLQKSFGALQVTRDVNLTLVVNLLIGSLPGIYFGSKLCGKMETKWLRPAVALTLVFVGTRLI